MGIRSFEYCINDAVNMGWTFVPMPFSKYLGEISYIDLMSNIYGDDFDGKFTSGFFIFGKECELDAIWGIAFEFNYDATTFALKFSF